MSTVSPPSRYELLRELASMLLDDQIEGTLAVALAGYTDDGIIDLSVRPLPSIDPIGALYGFRAPAEWIAFGVVTSGTAHHLDDPDAAVIDVRVAHFLDRRGDEVSLAKTGDRTAPVLVNACGPPAVSGRVPDTCRRVLGLPTSPPDADPQVLWGLDWLDRVVTEVVGRDLGATPLAWPEIRLLHRGRSSCTAPWSILRRECAAGNLEIADLSTADAQWMDDGMFSRQSIAAYPDLLDLLIDLAELLPGETLRKIIDQLDGDGAF